MTVLTCPKCDKRIATLGTPGETARCRRCEEALEVHLAPSGKPVLEVNRPLMTWKQRLQSLFARAWSLFVSGFRKQQHSIGIEKS
jgi:hypothetical protein